MQWDRAPATNNEGILELFHRLSGKARNIYTVLPNIIIPELPYQELDRFD